MGCRCRVALALLLLLFAGSWSIGFRRPGPGLVVGSVRDADQPVPGAVVRFQGDPFAVRTDARGRFPLPTRRGNGETITAAKEGYFIAGGRPGRLPLSLTL